MARKQTAAAVAEAPVRDTSTYDAALRRAPLAAEVEASVRGLAAKLGVDSALPARERYKAIAARLARSPKPLPKQCHWDVLNAYLRGEHNEIAAVTAAEALGLGIKEAIRKAGEGWSATGAPSRERVPGEDDE